jgi:small subunit ribosomal protein S16
MLAIRLMRIGNVHRPFYRVVVKEKRSKRDGKYIERLGYYDPSKVEEKIKVSVERYNYWLQRGAQPSETVRSLIKTVKQIGNTLT